MAAVGDRGAADGAGVGEPPAREQGAPGALLGRVGQRGERLAEQAGGRLGVAGAQQRERAEQPAVAGELGLAAQARLDVARGLAVGVEIAVDHARAAAS